MFWDVRMMPDGFLFTHNELKNGELAAALLLLPFVVQP